MFVGLNACHQGRSSSPCCVRRLWRRLWALQQMCVIARRSRSELEVSTMNNNVEMPRRCRTESDLAALEKRIYDLETGYFEETAAFNVVHGWGGFVK